MKILILGHGWYGCMIGIVCLLNNIEFLILDKNTDVFSGSSSKNQNRLHLGFHYPRSRETIDECANGHYKFADIFGDYIEPVENNMYGIDKNSKINFDRYKQIFNITDDKIIEDDHIENLQINHNMFEKIFLCDEQQINHDLLKKRFNETLKNYVEIINEEKISFDKNKVLYNNIEYDYFFNCTYGQSKLGFSHLNNDYFYEVCLSIVYKSNLKTNNFALTVMDGDFMSLYPYKNTDLFTLTHVTYTPLYNSLNIDDINKFRENINDEFINKKKEIFESEICKYITNFKDVFSYHDYFISNKCKFISETSDRSLKHYINDNKIMFIGGKITGIFEMLNIIEKQLNIKVDYKSIKKMFQ